MKSAVVVFACVLVAAAAQAQSGRYYPDNYSYNGYNNRYNKYQNRYRPSYQTSTLFPRFPVSTIAPIVSTPAPFPAFESASVTPVPVVPVVPVAKIASSDALAETVRFGNENTPEGAFNYFYETNNGIAAQAQGVPRLFGGEPPVAPSVIQGSFSWTSPEGKPITITYTADENGYQPSGDAIPQPPAIPEQIARALEYIAKNAPLTQSN